MIKELKQMAVSQDARLLKVCSSICDFDQLFVVFFLYILCVQVEVYITFSLFIASLCVFAMKVKCDLKEEKQRMGINVLPFLQLPIRLNILNILLLKQKEHMV